MSPPAKRSRLTFGQARSIANDMVFPHSQHSPPVSTTDSTFKASLQGNLFTEQRKGGFPGSSVEMAETSSAFTHTTSLAKHVSVSETKSGTELTLRNVESELGISSFNLRLILGLSEETSTMMLFRTANALRSKFPKLFNLFVEACPRVSRMREASQFALLTNIILPFRCQICDEVGVLHLLNSASGCLS